MHNAHHTTLTFEGHDIALTRIESGGFTMGSDNGLPLEQPPHEVRIEKAFLIGTHPVTQAQWRALMGQNPSHFNRGGTWPVDGVSWDAANAFCRRLSLACACDVRLPTEAQWEYACRAGSTTEYCFGETARDLPDYAWFELNAGECTHPVGQKRPNAWGLYDMLGNVWEWCEDVWHDGYAGAPDDGRARLSEAERQPRRVLRGAAWDMDAFRCRSAYRSYEWKELATDRFGLRVIVQL